MLARTFLRKTPNEGEERKKEQKEKTRGLWKLTLLWKSAKDADFHSSLRKPRKRRSAFSQFPQAQQQYQLKNLY
jgi:hypothetical protein